MLEKPGVVHADEVESATSSDTLDFEHDHEYSIAEQRNIRHKIDRRLIIICGTMYCVSLMDRTNLGAAVIAGMAGDLNLIGFRYSTIALVFFVTYVMCQPPATILCRKIGPRYFLATITLLWGIVEIGFGFPKTWTEMIGLRLILGVLEAGFFPGCVYLISTWYSRYDVQKRYSVFYVIGCCASACGGILAYGFMQMEGLGSGPQYLGLHVSSPLPRNDTS
jgi:MFS family permease